MKRSEGSLCDLWNIIKKNNLCISGAPEGEEREKGVGKKKMFKEIMAVNFSNLGRDLDIQVHEAHRSPKRFNQKRYSPT